MDASGAASQVILAIASLEAKISASALTARDPYGFGKQVGLQVDSKLLFLRVRGQKIPNSVGCAFRNLCTRDVHY